MKENGQIKDLKLVNESNYAPA